MCQGTHTKKKNRNSHSQRTSRNQEAYEYRSVDRGRWTRKNSEDVSLTARGPSSEHRKVHVVDAILVDATHSYPETAR